MKSEVFQVWLCRAVSYFRDSKDSEEGRLFGGKRTFFQCIDSRLAQTVLWLLGAHAETLASP